MHGFADPDMKSSRQIVVRAGIEPAILDRSNLCTFGTDNPSRQKPMDARRKTG
jgi:hypothetical protein